MSATVEVDTGYSRFGAWHKPAPAPAAEPPNISPEPQNQNPEPQTTAPAEPQAAPAPGKP
jgi:hypothetical protein